VTPRRALAAVLVLLATVNVTRSLLVPGDWHLWYALLAVSVVVAVGVAGGLDRDELGLDPARLPAGARLGGLAALAVLAVLVVGALLPATAGAFEDERAAIPFAELLWRAAVVIPVGTVLVEELAFRGVLDGLLHRVTSPRRAAAVGAAVFGAWHVLPTLRSSGTAAAVGTFVATTLAGLGFSWLRRRSGSLLAPVLAHIATNSFALVVAWALSRSNLPPG
jgi:membrane protease YdiL (CAAX protease family)